MVGTKKLTASVNVKVDERELLAALVSVVEANTTAMTKAAEASQKMASEVRQLRGVITATQRKIGGEIGPAIDRMKETQRALNEEREAAREAVRDARG